MKKIVMSIFIFLSFNSINSMEMEQSNSNQKSEEINQIIKIQNDQNELVSLSLPIDIWKEIILYMGINELQTTSNLDDLKEAYKNFNIALANRFFNKIINEKYTYLNGKSIREFYVARKEIEIINKLKKIGFVDIEKDINCKDNVYVYTALIWASKNDYKEIVELLIKNGADVNIKDKYSYTALIWACKEGYKEIVELLLNKGANVNCRNNYDTALILACKEGYKEIVEMLINKGADINIKDDYGYTALIWAYQFGYKEIIKLIEDKELNNELNKALLTFEEQEEEKNRNK